MCLVGEYDLTSQHTQDQTRSQAKEGTRAEGATGVGVLACCDFIVIHHQIPLLPLPG